MCMFWDALKLVPKKAIKMSGLFWSRGSCCLSSKELKHKSPPKTTVNGLNKRSFPRNPGPCVPNTWLRWYRQAHMILMETNSPNDSYWLWACYSAEQPIGMLEMLVANIVMRQTTVREREQWPKMLVLLFCAIFFQVKWLNTITVYHPFATGSMAQLCPCRLFRFP